MSEPTRLAAALRAEAERNPSARDDLTAAANLLESLHLGCQIAYQREPTQAEGDAHATGDECFVPMGGWTGRRCRVCRRWVWGGPTVCVGCVRVEADR